MFEKLINWSNQNYSHLPWRKNRSLYGTLVSEIMLQQTTVGTVLNHFERFMTKYPDLASLADISEEQILIDWKGLGYYRRAKNLLKVSKEIQTKFKGKIPTDFDELISIPGIGPYTANALIAIGANEKALCVDANLERVLARVYGIKELKGPKLQKEVYSLFEQGKIATQINRLGARMYNEALMDLGRSICKARSASCEICPLSSQCFAFENRQQLEYPMVDSEKEKEKPIELKLLRIIFRKNDKLLAYRKSEKEWLSGQFELPTFQLACEDKNLKQYPAIKLPEYFQLLPSFKSSITKYKIENFVLYVDQSDLRQLKINEKDYVWISSESNLSTASLKALKI